MSMNDMDLAALQRDLQELARQQPGGWWRRHRLWLVPAIVLGVVLLGAGVAYWTLFVRVYGLDVCRSAMLKIAADAGLQRELGQPIQTAGWPPPSARLEATEREVRWDVQGPKGRAKAHVLSRLMMGNWETVVMEVVLADGKKVPLADAGDGAAEAPVFQAAKPTSKPTEDNAPAPQINLEIPR